jgi:hypothetical protein
VEKKREVKKQKQTKAATSIQNKVFRVNKAKKEVKKKKQSKASVKIQNRIRIKNAQKLLKQKQLDKAVFFLTLRLQCQV